MIANRSVSPPREHPSRQLMPGTGVRIRPAEGDEASPLATLAADAFRDTYRGMDDPTEIEDYVVANLTPSYFAAHIRSADSRLLVAEHRDELVGYALVVRSPPPACVADASAVELARLYLRSDAKGKGIGASLMHAAHREAKRYGATSIWLGVYDKNVQARAFYRRFGFEDVGTRSFVLGGVAYADPVMSRSIESVRVCRAASEGL